MENIPFGYKNNGEIDLGSINIPKVGFKKSFQIMEDKNEKKRQWERDCFDSLTISESNFKSIKNRHEQ